MGEPEFVDPSQLRPGPIRHESLPPELLGKIKAVFDVIGPIAISTGVKDLTRIPQMSSRFWACDLRQTLENQVDSANSCPADRGTRWVTAKRAICGSISTAC
jgi:hypothetical protein